MINVEAIRRRNGWRASARWIERLNRKRARVFRTAVLKSHLVKEIPEPVLAVGGHQFYNSFGARALVLGYQKSSTR
jgi:hypothetical protein